MWKFFNRGIQAISTWMATPSEECPSMMPSKSLSTGIEKPLEEPKPLQKKTYIEGKFKDILFDKFGLNDRVKIMEPGYFYYAVPNQLINEFRLNVQLQPGQIIQMQDAHAHEQLVNYNVRMQQRAMQFNAAQIQAQGQWNQAE